jgi:hypothetical protein
VGMESTTTEALGVHRSAITFALEVQPRAVGEDQPQIANVVHAFADSRQDFNTTDVRLRHAAAMGQKHPHDVLLQLRT